MKELKFIKINKIKYSLECRHCLQLGWGERLILSCKHAYHPDCLPDEERPDDSCCKAASSEPIPGPSHKKAGSNQPNPEHRSKNEVTCPECKSRKLLRCVLEFKVEKKPGKMLVTIIADYHYVLRHGMFWSTIVQKRWIYNKGYKLKKEKFTRKSEIVSVKSVFQRRQDNE